MTINHFFCETQHISSSFFFNLAKEQIPYLLLLRWMIEAFYTSSCVSPLFTDVKKIVPLVQYQYSSIKCLYCEQYNVIVCPQWLITHEKQQQRYIKDTGLKKEREYINVSNKYRCIIN